MDANNQTRFLTEENQAIIYLNEQCYSKEAIFSFIYESSVNYQVGFDKEADYYKLTLNPIPENIGLIMNKINEHQLAFELNKRTEYLRNVIVDYAFGKKKLIKRDEPVYLPFTFKSWNDSTVLITSYAGEFSFISKRAFTDVIENTVPDNEAVKYELIQKNILADSDINLSLELVSTKYRSRKAFLRDFTSLHMVVLTKGCNCNCRYCQASSSPQGDEINMSRGTARKVVDMIFASPSPDIKIEFQGGEPLLNIEVLKYIVDYSILLNRIHHKRVEFVVCTNLLKIDWELINYFKKKDIKISTSLDGPKDIHDRNRPCRDGQSSFDLLLKNLELVNQVLGREACSPLVTLTKESLPRINEIIDQYRFLGYSGIFLRPVNPYGNAKRDWASLSCDMDEFLSMYKKALAYILELNKQGEYFVEYYTLLLLSRILTPFATGFVDLQSPSGAGISGVIYDYNGDVYPSDEARMLARSGDLYFKLGNVHENTYQEIFHGEKLRNIIKSSILEGMPGCSDCVYQPYCGADPVRYYVESGQVRGYRPLSDFCRKNRGMFDHLFSLIELNDSATMDIFWSWLTRRNLAEVKI